MDNSLSKTTVLIVDDDVAIRNAMYELVGMSGYITQMASSAEEALEILKDKKFDVVITDIMMDGMDGLTLTDIIKKNYDTDVIVMTGYIESYSYEEAISKGASDFVFKPVQFNELLLRLKRVLRERELKHERDEMMEKLKTLAITDGLTNLYNSRHFYNQLELEICRINRYGHALSLLLLDIDYFKHYNDTYGHLEGDKVLIRLGQTIRICLRKMDSAYRYGGEEFAVLLPNTKGQEATAVAQRIRSTVESEQFNPLPDIIAKVTVSIGVTEYCPNENMFAFVQRADKALYTSKDQGRNRISVLLSGSALGLPLE
ncbi:MAG: diguanylate cyclase [Desulfobacterales bacterium]|nr:diguanylate cyclase [Desulfobacterales bacterium]MBF0396424.1 diguanylate cyclase [Desulfobacterales bacterium]